MDVIEKIGNFYRINLQENPESVFTVLKSIIEFDNGYICFSNPERLEYSHKSSSEELYRLSNDLSIKNTAFGRLEITRNSDFTEDEKKIFKTCALIISNLIKDIEITKIINMQIEALQEGIVEKSEAYKSEKSKNDFFANFSHELRTPLNSIINSSELLSEGIFGELNSKQQDYVSDIRVAGLRLLGMINDILDMAKLDAKSMKLNLTDFRLDEAADEVCNIIEPLARKKHISILKEYSGGITITADRQKVEQILFNLINNAIKYTPEHGQISVITEKQDNSALIHIKDNGIGIAPENHEKIFEKFVQLGSEKNSNGLGLTITKELVKLHNGAILLDSEPGKGSTFTVKLC